MSDTPRTDAILQKAEAAETWDDTLTVIANGAGKLERDLAAAQAKIAEQQLWMQAMVEKAASGGVLDGYRELGAKCAELERERDSAVNIAQRAEHRANQAEADRDALRADAERYRWLKDRSQPTVPAGMTLWGRSNRLPHIMQYPYVPEHDREQFPQIEYGNPASYDDAIDAAREAK